jgi:hypothetical protein
VLRLNNAVATAPLCLDPRSSRRWLDIASQRRWEERQGQHSVVAAHKDRGHKSSQRRSLGDARSCAAFLAPPPVPGAGDDGPACDRGEDHALEQLDYLKGP